MHALPYYLFRGHRDNVWAAQAAGTAADPVSLATCFAVWGVGLDLMQVYRCVQTLLGSPWIVLDED